MKRFFRSIHLYLSLAAGLVIMTCCFTGAVLVFEKELQEVFNRNRYFVKQQPVHLPLETLVQRVNQQYPQASIATIKIYPHPERTVEIGVSVTGKQKAGSKAKGTASRSSTEIKPGGKAPAASPARATHTVFINPYSGEIVDLYNYRETFFYTMFALHRWLLGGEGSIGKTITGVSTFIFLFILLTGIILWWPRNRAILKQRLKIKTDASWKRLNHDLHIVVGFYSAIFLFILAFTGLAWSFKWFNEGIYKVTGSSIKPTPPPLSAVQGGTERISYDSAFLVASRIATNVKFYILRAPVDSAGIYTATVLPAGAHESASDNFYIDQYSGKIIGTAKFADRNLGQRVRATFKPIHVGSIYGWPSKIIAFLVCIAGITFPVTGTIMWLNRLKKNKANAATTGRNNNGLSRDVDEDEED